MRTLKPRDQVQWVPPAESMFTNLEEKGEYWKLTEVAKILGVSDVTLRRLLKDKNIKAPSYYIQRGKMMIYVYTKDDIEELKQYFESTRRPMRRVADEKE